MAKRRNFTNQFKAKVALEALRGDKTVQEIAAKHPLHPNQVSTWKRQAIDGMADVFSGGKQTGPTKAEVKDLHAKIGRLWRSLKQEAICLEEISDGFQARSVIKNWMAFYNTERPHSALDRQTPHDAYWAGLEERQAA